MNDNYSDEKKFLTSSIKKYLSQKKSKIGLAWNMDRRQDNPVVSY